MKLIGRRLIAAGIITFIGFVIAPQNSTAADSLGEISLADLQTLIDAVQSTTPFPASSSPMMGLFYSAQFGTKWPPAPGNALNLPFWLLTDGVYVFDDRLVDYPELEAEALIAGTLDGGFNAMTSSSLNSYVAYGNPVYLTNISASTSGSSSIAAFDIRGGTNFVPYDILVSTNVAAPISNWNWLGIGYTSNRYTFSNQPPNQAYYILAKPSRTMVVGWGDESNGGTNAPPGITNALMVAAGLGQSLALLSDGSGRRLGE